MKRVGEDGRQMLALTGLMAVPIVMHFLATLLLR